jgi:hypothetical protein
VLKYLNEAELAAIDTAKFWSAAPYPWLNPKGLLTETGHRTLIAHAPDLALFRKVFGKTRKYGQASHDRFTLDYERTLPIASCWHEFVQELESDVYRDFICRLFRVDGVTTRLHWHYTPTGCSVSPHCDADRKIGSHIFYMNSDEDWRAEWGGHTLILDDGGRFGHRSAPAFEDFEQRIAVNSVDNYSLLFARAAHSWHGVEPIRCPAETYRKAFILAFEADSSWLGSLRRLAGGSR